MCSFYLVPALRSTPPDPYMNEHPRECTVCTGSPWLRYTRRGVARVVLPLEGTSTPGLCWLGFNCCGGCARALTRSGSVVGGGWVRERRGGGRGGSGGSHFESSRSQRGARRLLAAVALITRLRQAS